ncbi:Proteasome maturation protein OS=Bos taurus GN=POMP PE=2 SV=1 [Rhizoctonia solani AG-1 IB]|uniref:Proteasome maturation protein n=1 Tax=Thanatephorus cucumeris (strain AG1-IB / isolate 7/3/14) TaxID=1108050 RepID=A0A0B7FIX2_THACB|nr:Proteasome maturation protein OS=Bos taurus GN=POMP PE=2 SV=1 [Rhizoctonia solani AG-1 IB]
MDSKLLLVPSANDTATSSASIKDTRNHLGLHDTLRYGPRTLVTEIAGASSIEKRLENWEATQDNLKLNLRRNMYGMHAPVRLLMERKAVFSSPHMPAMPQSNIHLDILMGRDEALDVGDFFGDIETLHPLDIHADMERKLRL